VVLEQIAARIVGRRIFPGLRQLPMRRLQGAKVCISRDRRLASFPICDDALKTVNTFERIMRAYNVIWTEVLNVPCLAVLLPRIVMFFSATFGGIFLILLLSSSLGKLTS